MEPEHRHRERTTGYAKAIFVDTMMPGYLRDLSASGAQVSFMRPVSAQEGETVTIRIVPVHDDTISPFLVSLEVHWAKSDPVWFTMGGEIRPFSPQDVAPLGRLVEYFVGEPKR